MNVQLEEYPSPAEGIGLENRQELNGSRGFESLFLRHYIWIPRLIDIEGKYSIEFECLPFLFWVYTFNGWWWKSLTVNFFYLHQKKHEYLSNSRYLRKLKRRDIVPMCNDTSNVLGNKVLNIVINRWVSLRTPSVSYKTINNVIPDSAIAMTIDKMSIVTNFSTSETLRYIINTEAVKISSPAIK